MTASAESHISLHGDIKFFLDTLHQLGKPRGCNINPQKSRILTSCNGTSILEQLHLSNPTLANDLKQSIDTYSNTKSSRSSETLGVELTDGFRLLGTPVGSSTFAAKFFDEQLNSVRKQLYTHRQHHRPSHTTKTLQHLHAPKTSPSPRSRHHSQSPTRLDFDPKLWTG